MGKFDVEVETGELPPETDLLDLLNNAYGGWGDLGQLNWKYKLYPGFNPRNVYYIKLNGELAAFRRIFEKTIKFDSRSDLEVFVLGDTCVSNKHRGKGLYSKLHEETMNRCEKMGADLCTTYNRVGNTTYKANVERGWEYRILPVQTCVLSPEVIIPKYTERTIKNQRWLQYPIKKVPSKIFELLPIKLIAGIVEFVSSDRGIITQFKRLKKKNIPGQHDYEILNSEEAIEIISSIEKLYKNNHKEVKWFFSREENQIEHMINHPDLEGVLITRNDDGELTGFAPLAVINKQEIREGNVLDFVVRDQSDVITLIQGIQELAMQVDTDILVTLSDKELGPNWSHIKKQVLMWKDNSTTKPLLQKSPTHIGLYDVV